MTSHFIDQADMRIFDSQNQKPNPSKAIPFQRVINQRAVILLKANAYMQKCPL